MRGWLRPSGRPIPGTPVWRLGLSAVALAAYLTTTGCGSISVNDNTPPPPASNEAPPSYNQVSDSLPTGPRHDLAVLGVDFDPALDVDRIVNHDPINLIVGVSNQGNRRETAVLVKADLWNAGGTQRLLHTEQQIDSIAAGNVVPVHLLNTATPPFLQRYRLTVEIVTVPDETNTQNNVRSLDILVNSAR
jgi:hypothetical protein